LRDKPCWNCYTPNGMRVSELVGFVGEPSQRQSRRGQGIGQGQ